MSYHDYYVPQLDTDEHREAIKRREEEAKKTQVTETKD